SELGANKRQADRDKLGQTPEGNALLDQAQAAARLLDVTKEKKKAREEATRKAKEASAAAERQARQLEDNYSRTLKTLQEQADVHGR
uniref:hypothetical protein n=1 Tax=Pseudomonas viridiflava TaxID=33069 RepID=UPI003C772AAC